MRKLLDKKWLFPAAVALLLCVTALALFIAYYPLASGMEVPRAWCDAVSVFDNWMWY